MFTTFVRDLRLAVACLRAPAPRPAARVAWTFAAALGLLGLSMFVIWVFENALVRIRDEQIAAGMLIASLVWLGMIWLIWRPYEECRPTLRMLLTTLACVVVPCLILLLADALRLGGRYERAAAAMSATVCAIIALGSWSRFLRAHGGRTSRLARAGKYRAMMHSTATVVVAIGACFAAEEFGRRDSELLVAGIIFLGAAALLVIWAPAMARAYRKPLLDEEAEINIHCPSCGYSLIGMRELRCPECGTAFRLDELIRAQDYDVRSRPPTSGARGAPSTAAERLDEKAPAFNPPPRPADS